MKKFQYCALFLGLSVFCLLPVWVQAEGEEYGAKVDMLVQEYNDDAFIEIPRFAYTGKEKANIEKKIQKLFTQPYETLWNKQGGNTDIYIATYPMEDENKQQYVITSSIKNAQGDITSAIASFVFRKRDKSYVAMPSVLKKNNIKSETVITAAKKALTQEGFRVKSVSLEGYVAGETENDIMAYLLLGVVDRNAGEGFQTYPLMLFSELDSLKFISPFSETSLSVYNPTLMALSTRGEPLHFERKGFSYQNIKPYGFVSTKQAPKKMPLPPKHDNYLKNSETYAAAFRFLEIALMNAYNSLAEKAYKELESIVHIQVPMDAVKEVKRNGVGTAQAYAYAYIRASEYAEYVMTKASKHTQFYYSSDGEISSKFATVETNEDGVKTYSFTTYFYYAIERTLVQVAPDGSTKLYNWSTTQFDPAPDTKITATPNGFEVHVFYNIDEERSHYINGSLGETFEAGAHNPNGEYVLAK